MRMHKKFVNKFGFAAIFNQNTCFYFCYTSFEDEMLPFNLWYVILYSVCRNFNTFESLPLLIPDNILCLLPLIANLTKNYAFFASALESTSVIRATFNLLVREEQQALLPQWPDPRQL